MASVASVRGSTLKAGRSLAGSNRDEPLLLLMSRLHHAALLLLACC